ncbi:MAG: hypothetical protein N4A72_06305 [Bacteroidales bacterium]|jgi:hypothetical protein|nr:hypothetical protein [Bacteroidales bacterium]
MNILEKAISENNFTNFILGKEEYCFINRERGQHDSGETFLIIYEYITKYGEDKTYNQLNKYLSKILIKDLKKIDVLRVIEIIWFYNTFRNDGSNRLVNDWVLPERFKSELNSIIESFSLKKSSSDPDIDIDNRLLLLLERLSSRYNYTI